MTCVGLGALGVGQLGRLMAGELGQGEATCVGRLGALAKAAPVRADDPRRRIQPREDVRGGGGASAAGGAGDSGGRKAEATGAAPGMEEVLRGGSGEIFPAPRNRPKGRSEEH